MAFQRRQFLVVGVIGSLALAGAGPAQAKRMLGTRDPTGSWALRRPT